MLEALLAAVAIAAAPAPEAATCRPVPVAPESGARRAGFLTWLQGHAQALGDAAYVVEAGPGSPASVFVADVDNDGADEYVLANWEGSGHFLSMWVFERTGKEWRLDNGALGETTMAHDYMGPDLPESQLLVRFCGKVYVVFLGGDPPHVSPSAVAWEKGQIHPACDTPWLKYQRGVFQGLFDRKQYHDAHGLLDGLQGACAGSADPELWLWMQSDLALTAHRMKADQDCRTHIDAARASAAFAGAGVALQKALAANADLCRATAASRPRPEYDFSWVMAAVKKDPDQQLVLDPRFDGLLSAVVPEWKLEGETTLRSALERSIWLPDAAEIVDGRYVILSGCEPHNCGNKGRIWIDTKARQAIVDAGGILASTTIDAADVPQAFWEHEPIAYGDVDYVGPAGTLTHVRRPDLPARTP
jgi:hypothetical protein